MAVRSSWPAGHAVFSFDDNSALGKQHKLSFVSTRELVSGIAAAAHLCSPIFRESAVLQEQVFRLADDVTFERVPDGAVVLTFADGQLYSCNDTSAAFLAAVDGRRTLAAVAAVLAEEFDAPVDVLVSDLDELAQQMQSEGIIVRAA